MTADEVKAARAELGLTQAEFAEAFKVSRRAIGGWEQATRNGHPTGIPPAIALLVRLAVKHRAIRRELGIKS
jgi:DNA-binding transcriptional regulator YiaG